MSANSNDSTSKKMQADRLNFGACFYTPQEPRRGLAEYVPTSRPKAPVAADGECVVSPAVLPFDVTAEAEWQALIRSASGRDGFETGMKDVETRLDALIQTIVESGQEMLPLLRVLRGKAESDPRLSAIADVLQDRLEQETGAQGPSLAPREREVIELAAQGKSNAAIADMLNLQTITVAKALSRAYRKLDAKNRTDAVHKWMLLRGSER